MLLSRIYLVFAVVVVVSCSTPKTAKESESLYSQPVIASPARQSDSLAQYFDKSDIPKKLARQLQSWDALPEWVAQAVKIKGAWLDSLHHNVVRSDWCIPLQDATIMSGLKKLSLARSDTGRELSIGVFDSAPVYLRYMLELISSPLILPGTSDQNALMLTDPISRAEAVKRLAQMLGMLRETAYIDAPNSSWGGAVTFGTRFMYYHELGHLSAARKGCSISPPNLTQDEEKFAQEIAADQFAVSMLGLEVKNQDPNLVFAAFSGISIAMSLIASQEYVHSEAVEGNSTKHSIKGAVLRMGRILHWTKIAKDQGIFPKEAPLALEGVWLLFKDLLGDIDHIPSPIHSLVREAADHPPKDWTLVRNYLVKWGTFGDNKLVSKYLGAVHRSAVEQAALQPRAQRVVEVLKFVQEQTAPLEPELGLSEALISTEK